MQLFKQVYRVFQEKKINQTEPLGVYFDILHDLLRQYCFAYGRRISLLEEEELNNVFRETSEYVQQWFQKQEIDMKEIHIDNSEPVIEKFVSAFIFIFQRRMVKRIKQQNQWYDVLADILEDFEKQGIEEMEPDFLEVIDLQQPIRLATQQEHVTRAGQAAKEFILKKLTACIRHIIETDSGKAQEKVGEIKISQVKHKLNQKRITNRKSLAEILHLYN